MSGIPILPWRPTQQDIRALGATVARATRAKLTHDVRSWRNGQARFWSHVAMRNARAVEAPKPIPTHPPLDVCGRHSIYEVCTCGT